LAGKGGQVTLPDLENVGVDGYWAGLEREEGGERRIKEKGRERRRKEEKGGGMGEEPYLHPAYPRRKKQHICPTPLKLR
jgi:hypothetical protein